MRPLDRFLHVEAASGLLLLGAALAALIWANSPFRASYDRFWHTPVTVGLGALTWSRTVEFWINDGLMVVFFFVVGLEIRREIHDGELSDPKRAALPVAAAIGGMLAPAAIYSVVNYGSPVNRGWGVPMATDIAFAVGVLALLGKRVPAALRVLLLALAIIDDVGAILVIAVFYSSSFAFGGLVVAALGVLGVLALRAVGVRRTLAYVVPGVVLWAGLLITGVHPTIAGVILGLLTPVRSWYGEEGFIRAAEHAVEEFRSRAGRAHDAHDLLEPLGEIAEARREAVSPVVRLEAALHPWVAYGIMPLFALANAGVDLEGVNPREPASLGIVVGVVLGLVVGKPLGVLAASFVAVRLGIAGRPGGVTWRGLVVVGAVAGIGFTMAIFIAELAFSDARSLGAAKLAVLLASACAGVIALGLGRVLLPASTDV
jgi:NhaA family Na+:H+ antiporter